MLKQDIVQDMELILETELSKEKPMWFWQSWLFWFAIVCAGIAAWAIVFSPDMWPAFYNIK